MSAPETVNLTDSIAPRSDQQNFDDYLSGPRTVTIERVTNGSAEQPIDIHLVEYPGRPYKPSKSMRRVLVSAWGIDASVYAGRRMRLYGDPEVKFGGQTVGGIKISHLSHIEKASTISLTSTRGKRSPHRIEPLPDEPAGTAPAPLPERIAKVLAAFQAIDITEDQIAAKLGKARGHWDAEDVAKMGTTYTSITKGGADKAELFPAPGSLTSPPDAVTDEQIQDLAQAREQAYGKTAKAQQDWAAWVNETTGRTVAMDRDLTRDEAEDILALLAAKDAK